MKKIVKMIRRLSAALLTGLLVGANAFPAMAAESTAADMRLARTEGMVFVKNRTGRDMGTKADMKLFDGYHVETKDISYAWIDLDSSKLIKLDAASEAEIRKKNKNLEILLNSGNLYFNVTEKLAADETLNIRTSTMVTGIRGTAGWVKIHDSRYTSIYLLDGSVECSVTDTVTGQTKSTVIHAGEKADLVVHSDGKAGDRCDILINRCREEEVDGFVAVELQQDKSLSSRVAGASGLDVNKITQGASEKLQSDQNTLRTNLKQILDQTNEQKNSASAEPEYGTPEEWTNRNSDDTGSGSSGGSSSGGTGGGSSSGDSGAGNSGSTGGSEDTPTTPEPTDPAEPAETEIALTMPLSAAKLNEYLQKYDTVTISSESGNDTLTIDTPLTIAAGKTVTIESGILLHVSSAALQIDGTLQVADDLVNENTITNTSSNTLIVGATLDNKGKLINTGRIISDVVMCTGDTAGFDNHGLVEARLIDVSGAEAYNYESGTIRGTIAVGSSPTKEGYFENLGVIASRSTDDGSAFAEGSIRIGDGTVKIASGSVEKVSLESGKSALKHVGGTVENIQAEEGTAVIGENASVSFAISIKNGAVKVVGGTVDSVSMHGSCGNFLMSGGTVGTLAMTDGTAAIEGSAVIENGITAEWSENSESGTSTWSGSPMLSINGGTIQAGSSTYAIRVDCENPTLKSAQEQQCPNVLIHGATIDGGTAGYGVYIVKGIVDIVDLTSTAITSGKADKTIMIEDEDAGNSLYRVFESDSAKLPAYISDDCSYVICTMDTDEQYRMKRVGGAFAETLESMTDGEILTLRKDERLSELDNIAVSVTLRDGTDTPVVLDLNGHTVSGYQFEIFKGSWDICDTSSSPGMLLFDDGYINNAGNLTLRNAVFKNNAGGHVLCNIAGGTATVTDGASIEGVMEKEGYFELPASLIIVQAGTVILGETDKEPVTVSGAYECLSRGMIDVGEADLRIQNASVTASIAASDLSGPYYACAIMLNRGSSSLTLEGDSSITSTCSGGALILENDNQGGPEWAELNLESGTISDEAEDASAILYTIGGIYKPGSLLNVLPSGIGTDIRSRNRSIVKTLEMDTANGDTLKSYKQDGYESVEGDDGYWHLISSGEDKPEQVLYMSLPASSSNASRSLAALSEKADDAENETSENEISENEISENEEISSEDEDGSQPLPDTIENTVAATPSNAVRSKKEEE